GTSRNAANCWAAKVPMHLPILVAGAGIPTAMGRITRGVTVTTRGTPLATPAAVDVSIPNMTGLIAMSVKRTPANPVTNMATSVGFPWTTGRVKLSAPNALAEPEVFSITGKDSRTAMGAGTLSLVSGALSNRKVSGPNANPAWARYTLPE